MIFCSGCCDQKVDHSDRNNGSLRACGNLLNTLKSSAQMLLDVIDDVLDLSKIESGMWEWGVWGCGVEPPAILILNPRP
jgi:hypothetical protein